MKNILMYPHGGSGNHGCEAIVRATVKLLNPDCPEENWLYSASPVQDFSAGLDQICNVRSALNKINRRSVQYIKAGLQYRILKKDRAFDMLAYDDFLRNTDRQSLALSIGGDNYCYGVPESILFLNQQVRNRKAKNVLWGCSVEPDAIAGRTEEDLAGYDLITVRESISYDAIRKVNANTILCADPAFVLDTEYLPLPEGFTEGNTVGINVSPLVLERETEQGLIRENCRRLIQTIIQSTDCQIALIPHVCWETNDDRKPLRELWELFSDTGRVVLLDEYNCMQLKGFIARCRFLVAARTHASIAGYSSMVPTLVLGYSVKAKGIAKDIFGSYENYVIPVQELNAESDLTERFRWLMDHEREVRNHLKSFMPGYIAKAWEAGNALKKV